MLQQKTKLIVSYTPPDSVLCVEVECSLPYHLKESALEIVQTFLDGSDWPLSAPGWFTIRWEKVKTSPGTLEESN